MGHRLQSFCLSMPLATSGRCQKHEIGSQVSKCLFRCLTKDRERRICKCMTPGTYINAVSSTSAMSIVAWAGREKLGRSELRRRDRHFSALSAAAVPDASKTILPRIIGSYVVRRVLCTTTLRGCCCCCCFCCCALASAAFIVIVVVLPHSRCCYLETLSWAVDSDLWLINSLKQLVRPLRTILGHKYFGFGYLLIGLFKNKKKIRKYDYCGHFEYYGMVERRLQWRLYPSFR